MHVGVKKRILAIDYGTKRIGIAISDPFCLFPSITDTIPRDKNTLLTFLQMIDEKNVGKILIGYPENDAGKSSDIAKEIISFKAKIEKKSNLEVILWDENFTSKIAESRIISTVTKKSKRRDKSLIDAQSAAIILEEYLKNL